MKDWPSRVPISTMRRGCIASTSQKAKGVNSTQSESAMNSGSHREARKVHVRNQSDLISVIESLSIGLIEDRGYIRVNLVE